jgi:acyl-CoA thioester hydrolase
MTDRENPVDFASENGNDRDSPDGLPTFRTHVRVAYHETDGQRRVHHSNYLNYFEQARVEMLRSYGVRYRDFEDAGLLLVVAEMNVKYRSAAEFDDLLQITISVVEIRGTRIRHRYVIDREGEVIVEAESMIACIDRTGRVRRLPQEWRTYFG